MQFLRAIAIIDASTWFRGVIGAFISGGAGSIAAGFSASVLDKTHDLNILALMGLTFVISGIVSMAKFLEITPLPPAPPKS
jgi:hypothetical protein